MSGARNSARGVCGALSVVCVALSLLLAACTRAFVDFCALEMEANPEACEASVEQSLAMVTSLNPHIGYEKAAAIAKRAYAEGRPVLDVAREMSGLDEAELRRLLDPAAATKGGMHGGGDSG